MTHLPSQERRRHERYRHVLDVHTRCLLSTQTNTDPPKEFDGRIQNLSNNGACILSSYPLEPAAFVSCSFPVFDAPVSVPTLMQVRWTTKIGSKAPSYVIGFEFVG